jgi:hypothetical protein
MRWTQLLCIGGGDQWPMHGHLLEARVIGRGFPDRRWRLSGLDVLNPNMRVKLIGRRGVCGDYPEWSTLVRHRPSCKARIFRCD